MKAVLVAGTVSGVGKTTIATGLMGALARRGLKVQPYKTGPDYIDPSYHTRVTGQASRNLDTWMLPPEAVIELYGRAAAGKDIAVIEGVMGLYDGYSGIGEAGSTAELAKLLGVPVLLVVDCRKGARSLAAIVGGYRDFDKDVNLAGVILNGIGSPRHLEFCREAIEHYTGVPVAGHIPQREALVLPERHLGLVPEAEVPVGGDFLDALIAQCEETLDIKQIINIARQARTPRFEAGLYPPQRKPAAARIAVARDKAFTFYYQDSLDLLEAWGAEIVPFSPLDDEKLPPDTAGLYIGGGFPELYAGELAGNAAMRRAVREAASSGMPVYAECGGLMYLGESIEDLEGNEYPMAGAISVASQIASPRLSLGYRTVAALGDGPMLRRGETVRGHEFHWSVMKKGDGLAPAYEIQEAEGRREGYQDGQLLASYIHLHLGALPHLAPRFVAGCAGYRKRR